MTHVEYIHKYAQVRQNVDQCVLILTGLRFRFKEYFIIKILGALYEPFAGPHYVQIADEPPFWVHSLTAFRREFFGLTDKLSFERSVFVGLSDGEVIRLKIARPYLFMANGIALQPGVRMRIMKTPTDFFYVTQRDIDKHNAEIADKKRSAMESNQAVRTRVRNHLVGSVQQLFCSYMRDTNITTEQAYQWFQTDMQHAMQQCNIIYGSFTRVRPLRDVHDYTPEAAARPEVMTSNADVATALMSHVSRVDHSISEMMRDQRHRERTGLPPMELPAIPGHDGGVLGLMVPEAAAASAVQPMAPAVPMLPPHIGGHPNLLLMGIMEDANERDAEADEDDIDLLEDGPLRL